MSQTKLNQCPKCNHKNIIKNGFAFGKQRYKCNNKECNYNFTVNSRGYPESKRQEAIDWYLEGNSLRSIARMLKVSLTTIMRWIRQAASKLPEVEKKYRTRSSN